MSSRCWALISQVVNLLRAILQAVVSMHAFMYDLYIHPTVLALGGFYFRSSNYPCLAVFSVLSSA